MGFQLSQYEVALSTPKLVEGFGCRRAQGRFRFLPRPFIGFRCFFWCWFWLFSGHSLHGQSGFLGCCLVVVRVVGIHSSLFSLASLLDFLYTLLRHFASAFEYILSFTYNKKPLGWWNLE